MAKRSSGFTRPAIIDRRIWSALLAILVAFVEPARAGASISIEVAEDRSAFFADENLELPIVVRAERPFEGRVAWSIAVGWATVARGEVAAAVGPQEPQTLKIRAPLPAVNEGVVVSARLSLAAMLVGRDDPEAVLERNVWIYPRDPFTNRSQWLKRLDLLLFDPEGNTRRVFEEAGIPFTETKQVASLDQGRRGLVIIGEGASLRKHGSLPAILARAASRGTAVLCLAPLDGQIELPGAAGTEPPIPDRLVLRREEVIRELDKRLDARAWPPDGEVAASSLVLRCDRGRIVIEASKSEDGWAWLEIGFPVGRGKLVVCGFALMEKWERGPTPRFLLARILENLSGIDKEHEP